jgi:hypothetical protein
MTIEVGAPKPVVKAVEKPKSEVTTVNVVLIENGKRSEFHLDESPTTQFLNEVDRQLDLED